MNKPPRSGPAPSQVCSHPEHHVQGATALLGEAARICEERGVRLTPLRERVLALIAGSARPLKAYELMDLLRGDRGAVAPPTVYRALDFLLEQGLIHKLESINAFVGCHHPRVQHSVPFLICNRCNSAVELEDERVIALLTEQARQLGFRPRAHTLEVHGVCARCSEQPASS